MACRRQNRKDLRHSYCTPSLPENHPILVVPSSTTLLPNSLFNFTVFKAFWIIPVLNPVIVYDDIQIIYNVSRFN